MNAKVYCFGSAKGGSGKTVITANVASFLASLGKNCLVVDCDASTNGMTLMYLTEVSSSVGEFRQGLFDDQSENDSDYMSNYSILTLENGVDFLPATYAFQSSTDLDRLSQYRPGTLEQIVKDMRLNYDIIFLDTQAGSDRYARMAMSRSVSDEVILVSEYDPLSSAGVDRLRHLLGDDLSTTRTWILLNKMLPEFVDKFSEFLSVTRYLPPIPWNADVVRAYARRKLALDTEKGNEFTLSIMRTVSSLFGEGLEEEIASWAKERAYALRAPLEEQYRDAEKELAAALDASNRLRAKERRNLILRLYLVTVSVAAVIFAGVYLSETNVSPQNSFGSIESGSLVYMAASFVIASGAVFWAMLRWFGRGRTTESLRYERVIESLKERLAKLETLRSADYETLLKRRPY